MAVVVLPAEAVKGLIEQTIRLEADSDWRDLVIGTYTLKFIVSDGVYGVQFPGQSGSWRSSSDDMAQEILNWLSVQ